MDGLSQIMRQKRINEIDYFSVVDNSMESLLDQMKTLSSAIHYYDLNGTDKEHKEYFDQFLNEVKYIHQQVKDNTCDQNAEPAQALMYVFLYHLHAITAKFNDRWHNYANWYFNDILKIAPLPILADTTWIALSKNIPGDIFIPQGTGFVFSETKAEDNICYRSVEDIRISNVVLRHIYAVHFEKNPDIYPASLSKVPTALNVKNLPATGVGSQMIFANSDNSDSIHSLGLQISSPSLLLREGKRFVNLEFKSEKNKTQITDIIRKQILKIVESEKLNLHEHYTETSEQELLSRIFSNLFYLEISTPQGWVNISSSFVSMSDGMDTLMIKIELPEDFPQTEACSTEVHCQETIYPTLRILLNRDSWLYPYNWLKEFQIAKIIISTRVEGISNLLLYNELGRIDNSIPFSPFGTNTECGAWFALGSYEMAVKKIQSADVYLQWQQLPQDEGGLFSYYEGYKSEIDNRSFRLKAKYLSDYRWKDTPKKEPLYLFSTLNKNRDGEPERETKLSDESVLSDIPLKEMKPIGISENDYTYSIQAKTGFFNFVLDSPSIGFGEKKHRQLFTEQMTLKSLRKKLGISLNPPITPLVERITISYTSKDEIDLRTKPEADGSIVSHIYPLGEQQIYPNRDNQPKAFIYSLETDANILFAFEHLKGDEVINLFFDFTPQVKEIPFDKLPQIIWFWGDGYHWEKLPDGSMLKNRTMGFLISGNLKIYIPEIPSSGFRDKNGLVWLRAGIIQNEQSISMIRNVHIHVVHVKRDSKNTDAERTPDFKVNSSEYSIPGVSEIKQITPFSQKRRNEDQSDKLMRVSEFVTHRNRAITVRDYERMTLQAFPQVNKVKCLPNIDTKITKAGEQKRTGVVTLVIMPELIEGSSAYPCASPELLIGIEKYFEKQTSPYVRFVDAINPEYEELFVRCRIKYARNNHVGTYADVRATIRQIINNLIAPWIQEKESPSFSTSIRLSQFYERIAEAALVEDVDFISVVQLSRKGEKQFLLKEYKDKRDIITATRPYAVLVPAENHIIASEVNEEFGIGEMGINENFVIWQSETGTP